MSDGAAIGRPGAARPVTALPTPQAGQCRAWLATGLLLGALQAHASGAAAASGVDAGAAALAGDETSVLTRIRSAIGQALCTQDAQCRTLAVGEKSCGGPEAWLVWSTTSPKAAQLPGWAAQSAAAARQRNANSGMVGTCQFNPDPGAVCQAGRCVPRVAAAPPVR